MPWAGRRRRPLRGCPALLAAGGVSLKLASLKQSRALIRLPLRCSAAPQRPAQGIPHASVDRPAAVDASGAPTPALPQRGREQGGDAGSASIASRRLAPSPSGEAHSQGEHDRLHGQSALGHWLLREGPADHGRADGRRVHALLRGDRRVPQQERRPESDHECPGAGLRRFHRHARRLGGARQGAGDTQC